MDEQRVPLGTRAFVLTVSDGVAGGTRQDESGVALVDRLEHLGFTVERGVCADDESAIEDALRAGIWGRALVISNGGTGLTPRDVTPQATAKVLDYEIPGLGEAMRAAGRAKTPMADLSRGVVGVSGRTLVINVPGSPRAALESLEALEPTLRHALETLAGPFDHGVAAASGRPDLPEPSVTPSPGASASAPEPTALRNATGSTGDPWRDLPDPRPGAVSDDGLR
jgi:molybdopterin adenylyltransferase